MIVIERTVDISKPVQTETLRGNEFTGEQLAHTFKIHATRDGVAVPLTGTVTARFLQANGASLLLAETCGLEGGAATVQLVKACYDIPGRFALAIYHTENGEVTCIYSAVGSVVNVIGDPEYDPGNVIGGISTLIDRANQAAEDAQDALDQASNIVSYADQSSESHTDAQKAQARSNIGAVDEKALAAVFAPVEYWDADATQSMSGRRVKRENGYEYTVTGTGEGGVATGNVYHRLSGPLAVISTSSGANSWTSSVELESGVPYTLTVIPLSGSIGGSGDFFLQLRDENNVQRARINLNGTMQTTRFYWPDSTLKGKLILRTVAAVVTNDFRFRLILARDMNAIPQAPATDGTYTLRLTVTDGVPAYAWVSESAGLMSMSPMSLSPAAIADETSDESEE